MFDIVPTNIAPSDRPSRSRARPNRKITKGRPANNVPRPTGPRVVRVTWKLPARLRRPIRQQLAEQRRRKRQRQSIIRFERRPLLTRSLMPESRAGVASRPLPAGNVGAEHHTGDTYRHSRPQLRVSLPPYVGGFVRSKVATGPARRPGRTNGRAVPVRASQAVDGAVGRVQTQYRQTTARPRRVSRLAVPPRPALPVQAERDVPFNWSAYEEKEPPVAAARPVSAGIGAQPEDVVAALELPSSYEVEVSEVRKPRRRFFPLSFSIWPKDISPESPDSQLHSSSKKKLFTGGSSDYQ